MATGESMTLDRIETALSILRADLVQRFVQDQWDEDQAEQTAREVVDCLRPRLDVTPSRTFELSRKELRGALRYINDNLDSKLTWHEIAAHIGVEAFGFGRKFKLSTGMTPHQYVIRCRVRRAVKMLARDELSLTDIALEVGCSCQSHLTTLFRKYMGTTPGAFRRTARDGRRLIGRARRLPPGQWRLVSTVRNTQSTT
jgi:transcriptional regulator GlxA family with amidase domain